MNGKVLAVNGIIVVLGIASAVTGFIAEANKIQKSEVFITHFSCVYPHSSSPGLGIVAAICTIINPLILLVLVGCCCCCRSRVYTSTPISSFFNILSWIASIIAVSLLLAAAKLSNREGGESDSNGRTTCYVVKPGIFAAGAVLSFLSAVFGIVAYDSVSSAKQTTLKPELALPVACNVDLEVLSRIRRSEMNCKVVLISGTMAALGIASAIVSFIAEATTIFKTSHVHVSFYCFYPTRPILGLGTMGAMFVMANLLIVLLVVGSFSCGPSGPTSIGFANLCNIWSWITSVVAIIVLLMGDNSTDPYGPNRCYLHGLLAMGGVLSLLSASLGIVAFIYTSLAAQIASKLGFELPIANNVDHVEKGTRYPQPD